MLENKIKDNLHKSTLKIILLAINASLGAFYIGY